jgi:branched-chain amino acid transport system permease protein
MRGEQMHDLAQVFANGLIAGSTVGVLAISYTLIYGALRFINFAFGEILMFGAFAFYIFTTNTNLALPVAALISILIVGILGAAIQVVAYRPFYRRSRLASLISAMGVSIILQNLAQIGFAGRSFSLAWDASIRPVQIFGASITHVQLAVFGCAIALLMLIDFVVLRTSWGLRLRAIADNLEIAELLGLRINPLIRSTFILGSSLAAASGVLLAFENVLKPTMGSSPGIQAFAACVAGGIGSVRGAALAAFGIGVVGHFVSFAVPSIAPETTAYAVLLFALVLFPEGLVGLLARNTRRMPEEKRRSLATPMLRR